LQVASFEKISPHFRADPRPSGGSFFRIYRDTRFSKDTTPYKTNVGIHFRHERAKDAHAPGYYLHIGPEEIFAGGGTWHPPTDAATSIREAIVDDPARWRRATRTGTFAKRLHLGGDSLKRVPSWADPEHGLADDLKRKDFFASTRLSESDVVAPGFLDEYARLCRAATPLMQFLCEALTLPYSTNTSGTQRHAIVKRQGECSTVDDGNNPHANQMRTQARTRSPTRGSRHLVRSLRHAGLSRPPKTRPCPPFPPVSENGLEGVDGSSPVFRVE
jgi:uncharacterized protein (TIGR02453 family)